MVYRLHHQPAAEFHQFVVHHAHIVGVRNRDAHLLDDLAGVDFMFEEERGDARFRFAVDDGPVDGGGSTVLRQQRRVQVECAHGRHVPHHFGQHAESYHDLQVGTQGAEFFHKGFVFQLNRLQDTQAVFHGVLFHGASLQYVLMTAHRFVRHGDDADHVVTSFYQALQALHRELRRAHIYNSQIFFLFHVFSF